MTQKIIDFLLNHLSEIISGVIGGLVGSGVTLHYTQNKQIQKNGDSSYNYQSGRDMATGKD